MTAIMIYHIRSKYTAVGRKEIVMFFWMYALIELLAMLLDSGLIPTSNVAYTVSPAILLFNQTLILLQWFAAVYTGLVAAAYCCLLINGFVGFQFAEDGTPLSLWVLRLSCLAIFGISFFIAIATFKNIAGFSYTKPIGLWVIYILWPIICVVIYVVSQLVLVFRTLDDRWPIGDIVFGTAFYAIAQVLLFAFSVTICTAIKHYLDGLFFFTLCILLSVMMVYKYWDSITVRIAFLFLLVTSMLTCYAERRPRIFCRLQTSSLGSERPASCTASRCHVRLPRGRREQLPWRSSCKSRGWSHWPTVLQPESQQDGLRWGWGWG